MKTRNTARVIVINPQREVVLVKYEDKQPGNPAEPLRLKFWVPPGGGVDEGETFEQAAVRELDEETGIVMPSIGPCVWQHNRDLMHAGELKRFNLRYFIAHCGNVERLYNRTSEDIKDIRWWSLEAIRRSSEEFLPEPFADLLEPLLAGELPRIPREI